jgi:hypothetical protein
MRVLADAAGARQPPIAPDAGHDADWESFGLQHRSLLDMHLQIGVQ